MNRGRVLITGASSGIGEALARKFFNENFELILTARRRDRLEALQEEFGVESATIIIADLASTDGIESLCATIDEQGLSVDILVNCAGIMFHEEFDTLSLNEVNQLITLNMTAVTRLIHHFLPKMKQRHSGRILNIASVAAFHPIPGMDLYAATKAFVLSLSESLSENLKGSGVSVTALCPGITKTEGVHEKIAAALPDFVLSEAADVANEGFDALMEREAVRVTGNANKLAVALAQHQPRWLVRGLGGLAAKFTR